MGGPLGQVFDRSQAAPALPVPAPRKTNSDETLPDLSMSVSNANLNSNNKNDATKANESSVAAAETSWNLTSDEKKCFDNNNQSTLVNNTQASMNQSVLEKTLTNEGNDTLYKTVSESPENEKRTVKATSSSNTVIIKNCLVAFMHSSEDFFIQMENFDDRYAIIKPEIDECFDPFDLTESKLCVTQFKDVS